jgi:hypothetical protein
MEELRIRGQHLDSRLAPKDTPSGLKVSSMLPEVCIRWQHHTHIIERFLPWKLKPEKLTTYFEPHL